MPSDQLPKHLKITAPSPWVQRWAHLIEPKSTVLDLAAGGGRHGRFLLDRDVNVTFLDKNTDPLADLTNHAHAEIIQADLEDGSLWPLEGRAFDAVVVVNYLYRPLMGELLSALKPGGTLIYETFALGNEDYARPRNPDHLLKSGELLERVHGHMQVVGYEHGLVETADIPGVKQRLCAVKDLTLSAREDGEPSPHKL